jgi:hypothetical protein
MSNRASGKRWWWLVYPIAVTVVGCGGDGAKALALAQKINAYLGTNVPPNRTGLVGNIEDNNEFHRKQYEKIACEFWKLQNPGKPEPTPCPPGGGPSTSPTSPPRYP